MKNYHLYFVDSHRKFFELYFANQEIRSDDWDDAPYEHNAEPPYPPYDNHIKIMRAVGHLKDPKTMYKHNSPYSVDDINQNNIPWVTHRKQYLTHESTWEDALEYFEKFDILHWEKGTNDLFDKFFYFGSDDSDYVTLDGKPIDIEGV